MFIRNECRCPACGAVHERLVREAPRRPDCVFAPKGDRCAAQRRKDLLVCGTHRNHIKRVLAEPEKYQDWFVEYVRGLVIDVQPENH